MMKVVAILMALLALSQTADAAKNYARRYPTDTAMEVLQAKGTFTSGNCLETDANGNVVDSGGTCGGGSGSPGGSDTQLQYNNSGNFGGIPNFTYSSTTATSTSGSLMADIFTVGTSTGVRFTATGGVLTMTEQNGSGTKNELTLDLENNSRITARSNTRDALVWRGTGSGNSTLSTISATGSAFIDSSSLTSTGASNLRVEVEGNNDWQLVSGGSAATEANYLSLRSSAFGKDVAQFNKDTGQAHFRGGDVTTSVIKTGTGGAGIDYKVLEVDGETYDLYTLWKEDEARLNLTSNLATENVVVTFGQAPAAFDAILDILAPIGYSAFGIAGPGVTAGFIVQGSQTSDNGPTIFTGVDAGTPLSDGTHIGSWQMGGSATNPSAYAAGIDGYCDGAWSSTSTPARLSFKTTPSGVEGIPVERMRIDSTGLISTSYPFSSTTTIRSSGTVGNTQAFMGKSTNVGCIMMRDTDDAGWTECTVLNGVLSCGTDADGVCDGTA